MKAPRSMWGWEQRDSKRDKIARQEHTGPRQASWTEKPMDDQAEPMGFLEGALYSSRAVSSRTWWEMKNIMVPWTREARDAGKEPCQLEVRDPGLGKNPGVHRKCYVAPSQPSSLRNSFI